MTYRVIVLPRAERQLYEIALWWSENRSPEQAFRWLDGFEAAIAGLAESPDTYGIAREQELYDFPFTVRQLLYGVEQKPTHRAIFEIHGDTVYVHAIRHLAQDEVTPGSI
ncbi:MAG: type II toxin-antitoxin system RelE/ParE family toxin [Pirellulales bacterium]